MKKIIISASLLLFSVVVSAQNSYQAILDSIAMNNTTLQAYREKAGADKIGNKTGNNLENPEVSFGHSWGKPIGEGKEISFDVSQSFDFPTAYRHRSKLIEEQNKQVDLEYWQQQKEVLQEARLQCIELVFELKTHKELKKRYEAAKHLSDSYQSLFDKGSINILERNKTKLNLLSAEKALQMNEVNIDLIKSELVRMNGGHALAELTANYINYSLPLNFDEWFIQASENNPDIKLAEHEVTLSQREVQVTKSLNLPKLSAGYTSEYNGPASRHGFTVGVSIPLWGGRNTVKHKKAQTNAMRLQLSDTRLQFKNIIKSQYEKAYRLTTLLNEYEDALKITNSDELLKKAFDQGQLSLINYLLELEVYYDSIDSYLSTEKDYQLALAELMKWES